MSRHKILLLNSGGADSLCSALILHKTGHDVYSLFMDYGQPNAEAEWESVKKVMPRIIGDTTDKIFSNDILLASNFGETDYEVSQQEIHLRNFVFMSYATQIAYANGIQNIATGYAFFQETVDYVDDNPIMLQNFHKMINDAFGMRLITPLAGYDKDMIYHTLLDAEIDPATLPFCNTPKYTKFHSEATAGQYEPCGKCHKCVFTRDVLVKIKEERQSDRS